MTAKPTRCNRCHRVLRQPPICGYGPKCAERYGLRPERRPRARQPVRTGGGDEQPSLLDLLETENEINEGDERP